MKPKDRTLCVHIQVMDFTKNILSHYFFLGLNPQPMCVFWGWRVWTHSMWLRGRSCRVKLGLISVYKSCHLRFERDVIAVSSSV